jgi:ABC-type transport system substrate-binding protein
MAGFRADYVPDAATRVAALRSGEAHVIEAVPYAQIANLDASQLQDAPTGRRDGRPHARRDGRRLDAAPPPNSCAPSAGRGNVSGFDPAREGAAP